MQARFGHDFGKVRVHTDAQAGHSATSLASNAYTLGNDIVFSPGAYAPHTFDGRRLLAHELAHVVQHETISGLAASAPRLSQHGDSAEEEARAAAGAVTAGRHAIVRPAYQPAVARDDDYGGTLPPGGVPPSDADAGAPAPAPQDAPSSQDSPPAPTDAPPAQAGTVIPGGGVDIGNPNGVPDTEIPSGPPTTGLGPDYQPPGPAAPPVDAPPVPGSPPSVPVEPIPPTLPTPYAPPGVQPPPSPPPPELVPPGTPPGSPPAPIEPIPPGPTTVPSPGVQPPPSSGGGGFWGFLGELFGGFSDIFPPIINPSKTLHPEGEGPTA